MEGDTEEVTTEDTTEGTTEPYTDPVTVKDGRISRRLKKPVGNRTRGDWSYAPRQPDDGSHWKPPPPPYRRNG